MVMVTVEVFGWGHKALCIFYVDDAGLLAKNQKMQQTLDCIMEQEVWIWKSTISKTKLVILETERIEQMQVANHGKL